ncbi:MAG: SLC13 family permease [Thermodesulfovibrionales bacterium]|nr:SLC13 family permease [Thermodesulfovibrionales bacterium]
MLDKSKEMKHAGGLPEPPPEIKVAPEIEEHVEAAEKSPKSIITGVLIALAVGLGIAFLPTPEGLSPQGHKFLALLATTIILWISESIPVGITAFIVGGGLVLLKIQPTARAWEPFASPAVMFVLMIMMFGVILNEAGVAKRILYVILKVAGRNVKKLSFFVAITATMLSAVFHDATITIILVFSFLPIFAAMGITPQKSNNLSKFFIILIALSASAGGFGTLLGGGRGPVAVEVLQKVTGYEMGFLEFAISNFPLAILTAVTTWAVVYLVMPPKVKELPAVLTEKLPPMRGKEKGVLACFALAFALWSITDLTKIHISVIAVLALTLVFGFKLVSFKAVVSKFPWETWIVFGAGFTLGMAMLETGAGKWIAMQFLPMLEGQSWVVVFAGAGLLGAVMSSFMSNAAATALILPVTLPMAQSLGIPEAAIALSAPISTSFIMLVIGCPPTLIAYSTGYFSQIDFIKVAVPWSIACLIAVTIGAAIYWPLTAYPDLPLLGIR